MLWVIAHNSALLLATFAADAVLPGSLPRLLAALSGRHAMLLCFLVANVATGAVNLSCDTLAVADGAARALLAAYMLAVCGVTMLLARQIG